MILCKYKGGKGGGALAEDVGRVAASAAKVADSQWGQKIYENHQIMNFYAKLDVTTFISIIRK